MTVWDAVGFHMGHVSGSLGPGAKIDAVFSVESNSYMGKPRLQLNLRDLQSAQVGEVQQPLPAASGQ